MLEPARCDGRGMRFLRIRTIRRVPPGAMEAPHEPERRTYGRSWRSMTRDLVFLPTSSAAPDYYGGLRLGDNRYANSIVALRASTGESSGIFRLCITTCGITTTLLLRLSCRSSRDGKTMPAVLQATKTGQLFVLHRETGAPIFPVEERLVPASAIPGEEASPTQPFTL